MDSRREREGEEEEGGWEGVEEGKNGEDPLPDGKRLGNTHVKHVNCSNDRSSLAKIWKSQWRRLMHVLLSVLILHQVHKRLKLFQKLISSSL